MSMDAREPWLSERQQRVWRRWLAVNATLPAALHRGLQESGLSLPDFEVLVQLSEASDGRLRATDLADALRWERSRLSHHVKRMEARGLVAREGCPEDRRGAYVAVTPDGRAAIEQAAPPHAATVRRLFFDVLTEAELETLDAITDKVLAALEEGCPDAAAACPDERLAASAASA
jgi:DNA-binding MarR family transcriptional regulator